MWLRYKPMVSVAYVIQVIAQFLVIYYMMQNSFQQKKLFFIPLLAGVGIVISLVMLHVNFMTASRYKVVLRLLGYTLGLAILLGLLSLVLQLFLTVEHVLVVTQMITIMLSTLLRYWFYQSLLMQQVMSIRLYPHWKWLLVFMLWNSVGILFIPLPILFIVETIFWVVIIQLLFQQRNV